MRRSRFDPERSEDMMRIGFTLEAVSEAQASGLTAWLPPREAPSGRLGAVP
jgi:hypothetical protein